MFCTRCDGTGFINWDERCDSEQFHPENVEGILEWIGSTEDTEMLICDCCGDGETGWYGEPGQHYGPNDPVGENGPYAYNGGLCECH